MFGAVASVIDEACSSLAALVALAFFLLWLRIKQLRQKPQEKALSYGNDSKKDHDDPKYEHATHGLRGEADCRRMKRRRGYNGSSRHNTYHHRENGGWYVGKQGILGSMKLQPANPTRDTTSLAQGGKLFRKLALKRYRVDKKLSLLMALQLDSTTISSLPHPVSPPLHFSSEICKRDEE